MMNEPGNVPIHPIEWRAIKRPDVESGTILCTVRGIWKQLGQEAKAEAMQILLCGPEGLDVSPVK